MQSGTTGANWSDGREMVTSPISVPTDFLGLHNFRWPVSDSGPVDPAPPFAYGTLRTHDGPKSSWASINTAAGVYDWTQLDAVVSAAQGKTIIYSFHSTPTWAASDTSKNDPYGIAGGGSAPTDMANLTAFAAALAQRYTGKFNYVQLWNEPTFDNQNSRFYWQSAASLVGMGVAIVTAMSAVDPAIRFMAPSAHLPTASTPIEYLTALDVPSGMRGRDLVSDYSMHLYEAGSAADTLMYRLQQMDVAMIASGLGRVPVHVTEIGFSATRDGGAYTEFYSLSAAGRRERMSRQLAVLAARGVRTVSLYAYSGDDNGLSGNLYADTDGVLAGIADANALLGRTITSAKHFNDGHLSVVADGQTFTF